MKITRLNCFTFGGVGNATPANTCTHEDPNGRSHERLGHGHQENEPVPRLVEALVGHKVIGAAAGYVHTSVWTEAGELFTFGGRLENHAQLLPKLMEALNGHKVVGSATGLCHTMVWTETGDLFSFGGGVLRGGMEWTDMCNGQRGLRH